MAISRRLMAGLVAALACAAPGAHAADPRHFSFGYDQPHTTGFGVAGDIFAGKLTQLSHGALVIDQFPGAQLGQEPQMLQKIRTGDIDFIICSTANSATLAPESGVFSLHFLFRDEGHVTRSLADPRVVAAMKELYGATVTGAHVLGLATLGLRDMYGKKEVHRLDDLKGAKVRVQATATEDRIFAAYGAQTVHMPFGSVYTSLQTGVMDFAENGINVYMANKHYEVAPVMSMTEHEANNSVMWVSDKAWDSFSDEQKTWVQAAADEVSATQPERAFALEHDSVTRLKKLGVRIVTDVDKAGFQAIALPIQDETAKALGPHAMKVLDLVRSIK